MAEYVATRSAGGDVLVQAAGIMDAVETACFDHGEYCYILAVWPKGSATDGEWRLVYAGRHSRTDREERTYPSLEDALQDNDDGSEILVAIPHED